MPSDRLTDKDLDRLEAVAKAATPGEWYHTESERDCGDQPPEWDGSWEIRGHIDDRGYAIPFANVGGNGWGQDEATHISTYDPPTALALVAEVRRLRAEVERLQADEPADTPDVVYRRCRITRRVADPAWMDCDDFYCEDEDR